MHIIELISRRIPDLMSMLGIPACIGFPLPPSHTYLASVTRVPRRQVAKEQVSLYSIYTGRTGLGLNELHLQLSDDWVVTQPLQEFPSPLCLVFHVLCWQPSKKMHPQDAQI